MKVLLIFGIKKEGEMFTQRMRVIWLAGLLIGAVWVLQSCVIGPIGFVEGNVTVGGGVTGRWEGEASNDTAFQCGFSGPPPFFLVFVEDSNGNLTGAIDSINVPFQRACLVEAILGKREGQSISFAALQTQFTGTMLDANNITGTFISLRGSGTWSVQRVPPIP